MNMKDSDNTKIYMIGAIQECPVRKRDSKCCYKPFLHMNLKTVSEMISYIPPDKKLNLVEYY